MLLECTRRSKLTQISQYCSKDCQVADWNIHKFDCKHRLSKHSWISGWVQRQEQPEFVKDPIDITHDPARKHLWGNMPAIDIVKLDTNEGFSFSDDINVLFAGSWS